MPESTEEKKTGIIETVMGIIGDVSGRGSKFKTRYLQVGPDGKPIIPREKVPEPIFDKKGKPQTIPLSTGNIVDLEV